MNDNSTTLVVYHSADLDGLACREIARRALPGATLLGYDYGQPVPDLTPYSTVYLLDISLLIEVMRANASKLVVIDHHRTLIDATQDIAQRGGFKGYYCVEGVAACRLAYQWFAATDEQRASGDLPVLADYLGIDAKVREPYAVRLLGLYDVWQKVHEHVDLFQLGMQAQREPRWDVLLEVGAYGRPTYLDGVLEAGRAIQSYTEVQNAQISRERGFDVNWEGLCFRALNTARSTSLTFAAALRPHHDACLSYFWNGRAWRFSFYHAPGKEHHDFGALAKRFGGGGHRGAAGCEMATLPPELGGIAPRQGLLTFHIDDSRNSRGLARQALAGDEQARNAFRAFVAGAAESGLETLRDDPRLGESISQ